MKIDIARLNTGDYSVETVRGGSLDVLGEVDMYDKAIRLAREIIREKGEEKGDEIWNWDGTFWRYNGSRWIAYHVSD